MYTEKLQQKLISQGYTRVERDDRLFDVFTKETADKGVELWEKWLADSVEIIRIHNKKTQQFSVARRVLEKALLENKRLEIKNGLAM